MVLPIILIVVEMGCCIEPAVCVDVQTVKTELFIHKDAVAAIETAEWNAQLGQSHDDTIWPSVCVHVEPCHLLSDGIQAKTYFK